MTILKAAQTSLEAPDDGRKPPETCRALRTLYKLHLVGYIRVKYTG